MTNLAQNMVKNVLESICDVMPDCVGRRGVLELVTILPFSCESFVDGYTAKILDLIASGLDPNEVKRVLIRAPSQPSPAVPGPRPLPWERPRPLPRCRGDPCS